MCTIPADFSQINADECKRILSVIERDFQLRQKESQRLQLLNQVIRQEEQRVEYLSTSKEFNEQRCLRCYKPFKFFFNPREKCSICQSFVCQQCSNRNEQNKSWTCKTCVTVKDLHRFTSQWFYDQSSQRYKRCGGAKVIRQFHKRDKQLAEIEEDPGYVTLPASFSADSKDSASIVIHDKSVNSELNEFSKRLALLVDNLLSELAERHREFDSHSSRSKGKETLKVHQQQIAAEIHRARTAVSSPLRRTSSKAGGTLESDLQYVLIQKTEDVLQTDLQAFQKNLTSPITSSNFDQQLAQTIVKKCLDQEISSALPHVINSPPSVPPKPQRQSSSVSTESKSRSSTLGKQSLRRATAMDEEDLEKPMESDRTLQVIRLEEWPHDSSWIESRIVPSDDDEEMISSWL